MKSPTRMMYVFTVSHTPHGVRGLKLLAVEVHVAVLGRTPHGVRGLKFVLTFGLGGDGESHPSRGAWIEMR